MQIEVVCTDRYAEIITSHEPQRGVLRRWGELVLRVDEATSKTHERIH